MFKLITNTPKKKCFRIDSEYNFYAVLYQNQRLRTGYQLKDETQQAGVSADVGGHGRRRVYSVFVFVKVLGGDLRAFRFQKVPFTTISVCEVINNDIVCVCTQQK